MAEMKPADALPTPPTLPEPELPTELEREPSSPSPPQGPFTVDEALAAELRVLRPAAKLSADAELFRQIHRLERPLAALCISGGGIRSATFSLGAIQALAERGLLEQFDYLSTVSGGGYIGSWLTAWKHRAGGLHNVVPALRSDTVSEPLPHGANPIHHLREYNNYLSPKLGALSSDAWTLVATVLRNILLNWLVLIPLLILFLLVPRYVVSALSLPELIHGGAIFVDGVRDYSAPVLDGISGSVYVDTGLPWISALFFFISLFNTMRYMPGLGNHDHSRSDYRRFVLLPLILAVFSFLTYDSLHFLGTKFVNTSNLTGVLLWAVVPAAGAWLSYLVFCVRSVQQAIKLLLGPLSLAIAAMAGGTGFAAWVSTNFLLFSPNPDTHASWGEYVTLGPSLVMLGFYFGTALFLGLSSSFLSDADREWMSRSMAGVLLFAVLWSTTCFLVLVVPGWVLDWHPAAQGATGLFGALAGWISSRSDGDEDPSSNQLRQAIMGFVKKQAALIFVLVLIVGLSIATNLLLVGLHKGLHLAFADPGGGAVEVSQHEAALTRAQPLVLLLLTVILAIYAKLTARFVNVNTFSLHGLYRDRLVRAYLGASNPGRKASRFTGFAADDDLPMADLDPAQKPLHVVNLTLNLVAARRLDWQQRKADSFTVTALACGNSRLGYRPAAGYGGKKGITLGTAVAISGAAASPNMGSNTSSLLAFVLTLFNARLGAWLGNPGEAGHKTWRHDGPHASVLPLISEALAQTTDESEYIYLSDGGHFENLALYEMVRRRCRTILVLDSGADGDFTYDDLGNALRKIRIDMKIPIEFSDGSLLPLRDGKKRCAVGRIGYSAVDGKCEDGRLIYLKPMLLGNEPPDVTSFAKSNPTFPHQSTADQFFDESQTESYRMMGRHSVLEVLHGARSGEVGKLAEEIEASYLAGG
jgi:hypothetical protein